MDENLTLLPVEQLPQTDEVKEKPKVNCLQEIFIELLNERGVSLAEVQRATNISWSTLYGWYRGCVQSQMADRNLLRLAQYFNVSLAYLCFGIGDSEEFKEEELENVGITNNFLNRN